MKRILLFGVAVLLLATIPVSASTFLAASEAELLAQSDAVVIGEVIGVQSFWNAEMTMIMTEATILLDDVVVGDAPAVMVVRTAGGKVGSFRIEAHGFPTFNKNDRLLLFVHKASDDTLQVTGYRQGEYRVVTRSDGTDVAVPSIGKTRLLNAAGEAAPRPKAVELDVLKTRLRNKAANLQRPMVR